MDAVLTRRRLLGATALALVPAVPRPEAGEEAGFSFPVLGDLHFDRLAHHDMAWLEREKPNDVSQVRNYSRLTETVMPRLFDEVREAVAKVGKRVPFVVHVGDLVEGLCGTPELARRHCEDALAFVREKRLGAPFLFTKGNHDVTGPGAAEAFDQVLLPFLAGEAKQELKTASYTVEEGDALFAYFDAYRRDSLAWLERALEGRRARHLFVVVHPPVVPFGARSTWTVFPSQRREERDRLYRLLGRHRALVLCGHLHRAGVVVRKTEEGSFLQLMVSSVIANPEAGPKQPVSGAGEYGPDLVRLEPHFSPETEPQRREVLQAEAPSIRHFEYAEAPGYAMLEVNGPSVTARLYSGLGGRLWKSLDLSGLLSS